LAKSFVYNAKPTLDPERLVRAQPGPGPGAHQTIKQMVNWSLNMPHVSIKN